MSRLSVFHTTASAVRRLTLLGCVFALALGGVGAPGGSEWSGGWGVSAARADQAAAADALPVPGEVLEAQARRVEVMARAASTAVSIFAGEGGGSGVVISPDGYVLSNFHVTKGAGEYMKCSMADGRLYDGVIVGIDPVGDVALVKLLGRDDFPYATMADSDKVQVGDWVFAVGNPFLLAADFQPTVTYGIVSGVQRYQYPAGTLLEYTDCIQTDASINPGNSGGPLFNAQGELIGINGRGSFEKRGRVNVGVGYAISINQIKNFLGCLKSGRIVDHATLGALVSSDGEGRVLVSNVLESSDAYRRGLRYGDEIVSFGGREIDTVNGFKNVLGIFPKGWRAPLTYRREGNTYDTVVRLAGVHSDQELIEKTIGRRPAEGPQPRPGGRPPNGPQPDGDQPDGPDGQPSRPPRGNRPGGPGNPPQQPQPQRRGNRQAQPQPQRKPIPAHARKLIEQRTGYANFHFNKLNRDRVWQAFSSQGDFSKVAGSWQIEANMLPASKAKFTLSDQEIDFQLPGGQLKRSPGDGLANLVDPPGSGGMMAALYCWRRMAVHGPEKFGDTTYFGTLPLSGEAELVDVLLGRHGGIECWFFYSPVTGQLLRIEANVIANEDPCELIFEQYEDHDGRQLPRRIIVRFGDTEYATFQVTRFDLQTSME